MEKEGTASQEARKFSRQNILITDFFETQQNEELPRKIRSLRCSYQSLYQGVSEQNKPQHRFQILSLEFLQ